jgi:hypothetical protein
MTLCRHRHGPSWASASLARRTNRRHNPPDLCRAFSALARHPEHFARSEEPCSCLSRDSPGPFASPPSLDRRVHSPRTLRAGPAFGSALPSADFPFRPRASSAPRRLAPRRPPRACCIPLPAMRFSTFPASDDQELRRPLALPSRSPYCRLTPRRIPLTRSSLRVTASRCLPGVTSRHPRADRP